MAESTELPRFDLALTMAGAVSAGAYSAGVIDFLVEALDAWEAGKQAGDAMAPRHEVSLRAVSGASAGAITAAVLAACLKYDFPHRRLDGPAGANPLYDSWVDRIDIQDLLQTRDLVDGATPVSLLDSSRLLEIARLAIDYGDGVPEKSRPYLADPLRFIFTLTNLRGVPYEYRLEGSAYGQPMMMHGDVLRFALQGLDGFPAAPPRGDEYPFAFPGQAAKWGGEWQRLALASLASGAFPVGLAPREMVRRTADYASLPVVVPGGPGEAARVVRIHPAWSPVVNPDPGPEYRFVNVDGGAIDNEPLDHARIELAGGDPLARNERNGLKADRAVVMIDPFVGPEQAGPSEAAAMGPLAGVLATFNALKNQARFRPQDIALALEDTVYSRYLIAPVRRDKASANSGSSIACGSLGGFGGFLDVQFRRHDYFLGRRNCQQFLARHLTLPKDNGLFRAWSEAQRRQYAVPNLDSPEAELPIVPLMARLNPHFGDPASEEREPEWPKGVFDPASLAGPVGTRLDGLFSALARENRWAQQLRGLLFKAGWRLYARPKIVAHTVATIEGELRHHGLL